MACLAACAGAVRVISLSKLARGAVRMGGSACFPSDITVSFALVIGVVAGVLLLLILVTVGFVSYKRRNDRRQKALMEQYTAQIQQVEGGIFMLSVVRATCWLGTRICSDLRVRVAWLSRRYRFVIRADKCCCALIIAAVL